MSGNRSIEPDGHVDPVEEYGQPWSHAIVPTGEPVYVSGQTPVDENGDVVHEGDMRRQFHTVLENVRTVLETADGSMEDLTELTIYVTDREQWHDADVSEVRFEYLEAPYPCSTLVEVAGLVDEEMLVEVSAVAHVSKA